MDYGARKTELRYTENELNEELQKLEKQDLFLKKIADLASGENMDFNHKTLDRIYTAATHARVLYGYEIEHIKRTLKLVDQLNLDNVRQTSFKEKLAIKASKHDLQKIRNQAKSYKYNSEASYNTFEFLNASVKIVDSFVGFCQDKTKGLSQKEQDAFVEQNFNQLLKAQTLLDSQIQERTKVKKAKITK